MTHLTITPNKCSLKFPTHPSPHHLFPSFPTASPTSLQLLPSSSLALCFCQCLPFAGVNGRSNFCRWFE
ncbi:hypothetical protein A2U01_0078817, partial [Trifolium medium]|nr:hypothetical protein [Trifolium medium]